MHIREAKQADFPNIGLIQAECNQTDTLARYFIKDMEKYPTTYRIGSTRFCKRRAAAPGHVTFVVETDPSDYTNDERYKAPEIVGFALWDRLGDSVKAKEWQARSAGWWTRFNSMLDSIEDSYLRVFTGVQCTYKQHLLNDILPILSIPFDAEVFAEAWQLELLFVLPNWQRKGIGKKLMQWGFDQATEEKVPVIVKSSPKGGPAYRAFGFESLGEVGLKQKFNTLEFGGEEPQLWCWEPEGCKGMFYQRGKDALETLKKEQVEQKGPA